MRITAILKPKESESISRHDSFRISSLMTACWHIFAPDTSNCPEEIQNGIKA
jgi:hypothetical protein